MKITIDTTNKTITVETPVGISELNEYLKKLLGDDINEYKLISDISLTYSPYIPYVVGAYTTPYDHDFKPDRFKIYCTNNE